MQSIIQYNGQISDSKCRAWVRCAGNKAKQHTALAHKQPTFENTRNSAWLCLWHRYGVYWLCVGHDYDGHYPVSCWCRTLRSGVGAATMLLETTGRLSYASHIFSLRSDFACAYTKYFLAIFSSTIWIAINLNWELLNILICFWVPFLKQLLLRNCAVDFVEICNIYIGKMIIKAAKRIFNSDKICRSYSDLNFGVTFLEHSVDYYSRGFGCGKIVTGRC